MSTAIQKSTELGVSRITPFFSAPRGGETVARTLGEPAGTLAPHRGPARWNNPAASGFPDFSEPLALERVLQAPAEADCTRLLFDPAGSAGCRIRFRLIGCRSVTGPEGGFAEPELKLAARCGYAVIGLGPRILRTETAPLAILAMPHRYGDMG